MSSCVQALKVFSDKHVFVKGKIVSLQAIVPSSLSFLNPEFDITTTIPEEVSAPTVANSGALREGGWGVETSPFETEPLFLK